MARAVRRRALVAGWLGLTLLGCAAQTTGAAPARPEEAVASLLLGDGAACFTDAQCGPPDARGVCVLATCFGLLTTDNHAARASLVERLALARPDVRLEARSFLMKSLAGKSRGRSARLGAVAGLGALLAVGEACDPACEALREVTGDPDEPVAVAARLALARRADPTVLAALLEDTRLGTEHLRASAGAALAAYVGRPGDGEVLQALLALLEDRSPPVRDAALASLAPVVRLPEVAAALDRLRDAAGGGQAYAVEHLRVTARQPGEER